MLKAVIFDMDDTLLDWSKKAVEWHEHERDHLASVFDYIQREVMPIEAQLDAFIEAVQTYARQGWTQAAFALEAPSYGEALRAGLIQAGVPSEKIDVNACLDAYGWGLIDGVSVFPDVPEVLRMLQSHGVQIGLITNSSVPMWLRDRELETVGILEYFAEARFSAVDVGYIKPHPAIFATALKRLGISPRQAVFVGDNLDADILGAQKAGMRAVLRWLEHRPQEIAGSGVVPDGVITNFHDLLPILDDWFPKWRIQQ